MFRLLKVTVHGSSPKYVGDFTLVNARTGGVKYKRQTTTSLLQPDEKKGRRGRTFNRQMAQL